MGAKRFRPCDGEAQDDTGAFYCRIYPEDEDYDCDECDVVWNFLDWVDRHNDMRRDEDENRDTWG